MAAKRPFDLQLVEPRELVIDVGPGSSSARAVVFTKR